MEAAGFSETSCTSTNIYDFTP